MEEIEAVLEDILPTPLVNGSVIRDWCQTKWKPAIHAKEFGVDKGKEHEFAADFCAKGMNIAAEYPSGKQSDLQKVIKNLKSNHSWPSVNSPQFKTLTAFLSMDDTNNDHHELSALMSQRTYYDNHRYLNLGSIIRELSDEKRYLLCLQPTCDCVRLDDDSIFTFVFCLLKEAKGEKASHVIGDTELIYKPKIENCITLKFKPTKGTITPNDLTFVDIDGKQYHWLTQMKTKHAQRAVEQFARELSRVGLTESEWLRLKAK